MIRVLLQGRLGNNLFQIAAALALAETHGTRIIVDASELPGITSESALRCQPALRLRFPRRVASITMNRINQRIFGRRTYEVLRRPLYRELSHEFDPAVQQLGPDTVLCGYFQDERYFKLIERKIPGWFDLSAWRARAPEIYREAVSAGSTIGVHVRRDDYLVSPCLNICGLGYYHRAMHLMRETFPDAKFIVFSDDIEWCQSQFGAFAPLIVDNRRSPHSMLLDLALLSACKHQIIANSSFSWWAAWLNPNPLRRVIMPDRWSSDNAVPITTKFMRGAELVDTQA